MPKNLFLILIILFVVSLSATMYIEEFNSEVEFVKSEYDKREYLVRNLPDKKRASGLLSLLRARLIKFIDILCQKYPQDRRIYRLKNNFNPNEISESTPDSKYTSYSVNKGEKI